MCGIAGTYRWPDGKVVTDRLTDTLAQPMVSDGLVLTYNGELYNAPELRAELAAAGVRFRGTSDTEVLLEAWRRWGTDCLPRLRGMFAFGIFDERTGELVLARDQLGIKPLFLHRRVAGGGPGGAGGLAAVLLGAGLTVRVPRSGEAAAGELASDTARRPGGARPVLEPQGRRRRGPGAGPDR